jgi:hypothetical protein
MDETRTFTVADVQVLRSGQRENGTTWTKFAVLSDDGEQFETFDSGWRLVVGDAVSVQVREREWNGKTFVDIVSKPPSSSPKPAAATAGPGRPAGSKAQGVQTQLPGGLAEEPAFLRLEAGLAQLLRRMDAMAAVQGDTAESVRTITTLLQHRPPALSQQGPDEEPEFDPADPRPPEPPEPDDEPVEVPDDV